MSTVIPVAKVIELYDKALLDWEKTFGYPVFGKSLTYAVNETSVRDETGDARRWGSRRRSGIEKYAWNLMLRSLAIGGDGPTVEVTFRDTIFDWSGPYQGNLRSFFLRRLALSALPQDGARKTGRWKGNDGSVNKMRIRWPHR